MSLQAIRTRCARFVHDFGNRPISSITTAEISDWILTLKATRARGGEKPQAKAAKAKQAGQVGLVAKRNHRLALSGLFAYAQARGWVKDNPVANAARHSFATFHLLAFRHAGQTALQLGHGGSPEMLHRHYKGMASEAEAKAFWAIRPAAPGNVVDLKSANAPAAEKEKPRTRRKA